MIYIVITLGTLACRKDKSDPSVDLNTDCKPFDHDLPPVTYFTNERFQYKAPHFNPNNSNEFIYHFRDNEQNEFQLLKYNLQLNQKTFIVESGKIAHQPKWSSDGLIAYTHHVGYVDHVYIVKENGDSLTQFTDNVHNLFPIWSSLGDELYWTYTPNLGIPYYCLRQNLDNPYPDTLSKSGDVYNGYISYNDVSQNNKLLSLVFINNEAHLAIASLNEEPLSFSSIVNMNQAFEYPNVSGLCWSYDEKFVYATVHGEGNGLYKISVNDSSIELLIPFCETKSYGSI